MAVADEIKQRWATVAPELREPLIVGGCRVLVQRGTEVSLDDEGDPGHEVLTARIPIDRGLLASSEGLVEAIIGDIRAGLIEVLEARAREEDRT